MGRGVLAGEPPTIRDVQLREDAEPWNVLLINRYLGIVAPYS